MNSHFPLVGFPVESYVLRLNVSFLCSGRGSRRVVLGNLERFSELKVTTKRDTRR